MYRNLYQYVRLELKNEVKAEYMPEFEPFLLDEKAIST